MHAIGLAAAIALVGCDSSSNTTTGPSPEKCLVILATSSTALAADGGTGTVSVSTQPECAWTATAEDSWISGLSPASGQGNGQVAFRVSPNLQPSARQGAIAVNDNRVSVHQEAARCTFEIAPATRSVAAEKSTGSVTVSTTANCGWTATSSASWLTITSGATGNLLAGTQHGEAAFPPQSGAGQQLPNPTPQVAVMHALLRASHQWVTNGTAPPRSRYPRLDDGTLVPVTALAFPALAGVGDPRTMEGPAAVRDGRAVEMPFLVSRVDADGNDAGGVRVPEVAVPLATTTGWNFRSPRVGNPSTIYALLGSYIPFSATRAERMARQDPRLSIEERYTGRDDYLRKIRAAAAELIKGGYLLQEDLDTVIARANAHWDYAIHGDLRTSAR